MTDTQVMLPRPDLPRATLGILFMVALIASTVWILRPFLAAIIWASMIVVATWPVLRPLQAWLWGSRNLAVAAMTATWLLVLVLPLALATGTIVSNAGEIVEWAARVRSFTMPPPPEWLGTLPMVGRQAVEAWNRDRRQSAARSRLGGGALRHDGRCLDGGHAGKPGLVAFAVPAHAGHCRRHVCKGRERGRRTAALRPAPGGRAWRPRRPARRAGHPGRRARRGRHGDGAGHPRQRRPGASRRAHCGAARRRDLRLVHRPARARLSCSFRAWRGSTGRVPRGPRPHC